MNSAQIKHNEVSDSLIKDFKRATERYSAFMAKYGREVGAWNDLSIEKLKKQGREKIIEKTQSLERQLGYYQQAELDRVTPLQEKQILWRVLNQSRWKFPTDLFPKLEDSDIIEIYDLDFIQFFANSIFMQNCSYDLSDIYAYTWPELFERPESYTKQVIERIEEVLKSPAMKTYDFNIEPHFGKEVFSAQRKTILIDMGIIAPLFDETKTPVAFICTIKLKQL